METTTPPPHRPTRRSTVSTRWWLQGKRVGNFGDALNPLLLGLLGFQAVPSYRRGRVNRGRCLFAIGSLLENAHIRKARGPIDVWGAGWRGFTFDDRCRERLTIHAVRGPRTAWALGTPDVPQGDPALLLPRFLPRDATAPTGGALFVPHLLEPSRVGPDAVGCDAAADMHVRQRGRLSRTGAPDPGTVIAQLCHAAFVLTGSLHGAIVAQAYGVPWAAWSAERVDCPEKWLEWGEYLGVDVQFVPDRTAGERWWDRHGSSGRVGDLHALLAAFPYDRSVRTATTSTTRAPDDRS